MSVQLAANYLQKTNTSIYLATYHHKNHKNQNLTFDNMFYLLDIYKDNSEERVLMKSTQSGITEWLIIEVIKKTYYQKRNVFYVMPTDKLKNQFVNSRFDKSITYTDLYKGLFKDSTFNNLSIKQVGNAAVFFAVSNSRNNFTSFPADDLIVDELDECNLENLEMAPERLAFSKSPTSTKVANPTYPDLGIDWEWKKSDQKEWFLICPHCRKRFIPDFFNNVVREIEKGEFIIRDHEFEYGMKQDARMICQKCNKPVPRYQNGEWIARHPGRLVSGRHLNQLFTSHKRLSKIIENFDDALVNETKMQRFYNGTLGLPYIASDAQISDEMINNCIADYSLPTTCKDPCVIGIDVGKKLHVVIFKLITNDIGYKMQLVYAGELRFEIVDNKIDISELVQLYKRFKIVAGIIDARPEARLSKMISQNFKNIWRCEYLTENPKDQIVFETKIFKTDRTASMDGVREQMMLQNIMLPKNIDVIQNLREQIKAPIRVLEEKEEGKSRWIWKEGNKEDHYYHAINYANIAKKLLAMSK